MVEFNYMSADITSSGNLVTEIITQAQKAKSWLFERSCLEKQILYEEGNYIKNI